MKAIRIQPATVHEGSPHERIKAYFDAGGELVSSGDAARILGVDSQRVSRWMKGKEVRMPDPIAYLSSGPVWLRGDVEAFAAQRNGQ
jgi:hypothetical protein